MTTINFLEILVYLAIIVAITPLMGGYMKRVFSGERTFLDPVLRPVERGIYRVCGVDASKDQSWIEWTVTMLIVNAASLVILYAMQRLQKFLPVQPERLRSGLAGLVLEHRRLLHDEHQLAGVLRRDRTMSHFTQMAGLALHNFLSAATGIAIAVAVIRGIAREKAKGIGNFWYDCTRAILWVLLPISFLGALFLVSRGVVQNFRADVTVKTVEGVEQKIAQGPVASQEAIKELGTNGGGFFNANSAHPYENPTPGTNFLEMLLIFAIGAGLTNTLGRMTGSRAARMGGLRGDGLDVPGRRLRGRDRRAAGQSRSTRSSEWRPSRRPAAPAATWRARRSGSGSATPPSSPRSRRTPPAAPSTPGTTRSPRSAASCRSPTSPRERSSSAASAPDSTACSCSSCSPSSSRASWSAARPSTWARRSRRTRSSSRCSRC